MTAFKYFMILGSLTATLWICLGTKSHASDDWLCKEVSSVKRGNSIYACGSGQGGSEFVALENSFYAAKNEFDLICSASSDCKKHKINVEPKRSSCEVLNRWVTKCYRLVVFTIEE